MCPPCPASSQPLPYCHQPPLLLSGILLLLMIMQKQLLRLDFVPFPAGNQMSSCGRNMMMTRPHLFGTSRGKHVPDCQQPLQYEWKFPSPFVVRQQSFAYLQQVCEPSPATNQVVSLEQRGHNITWWPCQCYSPRGTVIPRHIYGLQT